jgi:hypothetical protein
LIAFTFLLGIHSSKQAGIVGILPEAALLQTVAAEQTPFHLLVCGALDYGCVYEFNITFFFLLSSSSSLFRLSHLSFHP